MSGHFQAVVDHVMSDDDSELGKTKAELAYALHSLEREIAICSRTTAAFLAYVQADNKCAQTGEPCREWTKCGCYLEMDECTRSRVGQTR